MKVTITSMQGNTRDINLMTKQEVLDFIKIYRSTLKTNQRVKITCDLVMPMCVLTIFFYFYFSNYISYISTKYSDFMKSGF